MMNMLLVDFYRKSETMAIANNVNDKKSEHS